MEADKMEDVIDAADEKNLLLSASVDSLTTTIWAQFKNADPNKDSVEINKRQTVFYPSKPFTNFITVRGFTMENAATNWAPPTAEQKGIIGTNWSRGWIIENNTIRYSKCVGIALGKYGDAYDNKSEEAAEGYVGTINRALAFGWNKGTVGSHIVRNNTIAWCEQTGIVGSMGCSFSIIQGNTIHDIHVRRLFDGAEMAGIKFHGAIDVQIMNNHIYRTNMALWLDWMAQGAQVKSNLMHDNGWDIFLEVDHGPILVSNNVLLSKTSLLMNSSGIAFVHNLIGGRTDVVAYDGRLTPYHKPHSTYVSALHDNPGGDVRFINNLFVSDGNSRQYDRALLPVIMKGNVYTKGSNQPMPADYFKKYGNLNDSMLAQLMNKHETGALEKQDFDAAVNLIHDRKSVYLEINLDKNWVNQQKRELVTTQSLGKAIIPALPFENKDGLPLIIDTDYFGNKRNTVNPSPGPFEIKQSGKQKIKLW
jgi:hypothetical protein